MPRRVLMTTDTVGGVWSYALDLARALGGHDVEVLLAAVGRAPDAAQRADAEAIPDLTLVHADFLLEWMPEPWDDVARTRAWLLELERRAEPDIVHLNALTLSTAGFAAPTLVVAHSCVVSWWRAVRPDLALPPELHRYRVEVERGLRAAGRVAAPSRWMCDALARSYAFSTPRRVAYNGVWHEDVEPVPKEPAVLAAGRLWDEAKNLAVLREVAPRLPWPVWVAGEGGVAPTHGVEALGRLPRAALHARMKRAAVLVHPARYEPFGLVPLEAAARGCALVLGDIPPLREVWGDAALFVPPDDAAALERALASLAADPVRLARLAAAARRCAARYRAEWMAARTLELYRELLRARAPRPRPRAHGAAAGDA